MLKAEQIPDEVVFAMQDCMREPDASPWDWITAAINAWPGMELERDTWDAPRTIHLPLKQEDGE